MTKSKSGAAIAATVAALFVSGAVVAPTVAHAGDAGGRGGRLAARHARRLQHGDRARTPDGVGPLAHTCHL